MWRARWIPPTNAPKYMSDPKWQADNRIGEQVCTRVKGHEGDHRSDTKVTYPQGPLRHSATCVFSDPHHTGRCKPPPAALPQEQTGEVR